MELRRVALAALVAASTLLPAACSALVDTSGLRDGDGNEEEDGGSLGDAAAEREPASDAAGTDAPLDGRGDAATISRYAAVVLADSPLLYYRFGESDGTPARDEVSGASTPYPVAGFTLGTKGALAGDGDTAVAIDGSTFLPLTQSGADFEGVQPFSLELWADPAPSGPGTNDNGFVIDHEDWSNGRFGWDLRVSKVDVVMERWVAVDTPASTGFAAPATGGAWHHVVVTFDGTSNRLYYDGVRRAEGLITLRIPKAKTPFAIGKQNCTPCGGNGFVGSLDELAIYPFALSETRIAAHLAAAR